MPVVSIGDMSQHFASLRHGGKIKSDLSQLAESLSTGRVNDITKHLNGETSRFSGIQYSLSQLDAYAQVATEAQQYFANVQTVLGQVDTVREQTAERLLLMNDNSSISQVADAALSAAYAFETVVSLLNTQSADRALLGGAYVNGAPLASSDEMLTDLKTLIGGTTDAATITATVTAWFDDPSGGFHTSGYLGDTGPLLERRVSDTKSFVMNARADDPAIKDVLKAAAIAALVNDMPNLNVETKTALLQDAATGLFEASSGLIAVQARVGFNEAGIAEAQVEMAAQKTVFDIAQVDMISADPFDTASKLQAVQLQLETHYTITSRMSQLSLLRYI